MDEGTPPPPGEPVKPKSSDKSAKSTLRSAAPTETLRRLNGYLHRVTPIVDEGGKLLHWAVQPVMVEFKPRDLAQIVVGSTILGTPLVLTDEAMAAADNLESSRIIAIAAVSVLFITAFVFFNFYRRMIRGHVGQFVLRVAVTYGVSLLSVAGLLWLFGRAPFEDNLELVLRRTVVVGFPAAMFATVADAIK